MNGIFDLPAPNRMGADYFDLCAAHDALDTAVPLIRNFMQAEIIAAVPQDRSAIAGAYDVRYD